MLKYDDETETDGKFSNFHSVKVVRLRPLFVVNYLFQPEWHRMRCDHQKEIEWLCNQTKVCKQPFNGIIKE